MNSETETIQPVINSIDPRKLIEHPLNQEIYGAELLDPGLVASIRDQGILEPIVVVETTHYGRIGLYILSGHRRVKAAIELGIAVPYCLEADQGENWQKSVLLESNRQRVKNVLQQAREYVEVKKLELVHPSAIGGTASERAAERVGIREDLARKLEVIMQAAADGNPIATDGLKKILSRERTVISVFNAVTRGEVPENTEHYDEIAGALEEMSRNFFTFSHSPRGEHEHGYVLKRRFVNRAVAEAFINMMQSIPTSEKVAFAATLKKYEE